MTESTDERAERTEPRSVSITFWQGAAIIFGANIGAGILSLPFGARNGGVLALVVALAIAGFLTTVSMLYVAEVSLRTKEPLQLSGLARKYLGNVGSWLIFAGVVINGLGALIAYASGSGSILADLLGISPLLGSTLFFVPGVVVIWLGLKATGRSEQAITIAMLAIILLLSAWTFIGPGIELANVSYMNPYFVVPIINLAVFAFIAQYTVPELARGLASHSPRALPRAVVAGMCATGFLLALVPLAALGMMGRDGVSEVITIAWGEGLGTLAYYLANIFALLAMLTSFWAIGLTLMTNIFDRFRWPATGSPGHRLAALALIAVPPFLIATIGLAGFVSALGYAGGFAGAIMSIVPVLMLRRARAAGDQEPAWRAGWVAHPALQATLVTVFGLAFVYSLLSATGLVPDGWS
ncbi:amino acid permease [Lipingzhangella halophila]|uniref:Amino acid permease n=1 Tax=Lipingzhangella halophila TaxID=1783352 RepID=A0A7W7W6N2_9ACTN|nr:amino acid permease [Lipingzhangella halophila]MBB4935025.1 amino acid permease [Lipingzhangella halophila]